MRKRVRELGIRGICPDRERQATVPDGDARRRPGLPERDLTGPVPTHGLVGDITHPGTPAGLTCLAAAAGLATRMVVGRGIRKDMEVGPVTEATGMAHGRGHVAEGGTSRGDRGSQHASKAFAEWAKKHDVRLSVGRTGSSYDNAVAESFFGTPRSEWCHHERTLDREATKCLAIESVESHHDRYRPHEAVGDRVTAELMEGFFARFEAALKHDEEVMPAA